MKKIKFFKCGDPQELEEEVSSWVEEEKPNIVQINPIFVDEGGWYLMQVFYIQTIDPGIEDIFG